MRLPPSSAPRPAARAAAWFTSLLLLVPAGVGAEEPGVAPPSDTAAPASTPESDPPVESAPADATPPAESAPTESTPPAESAPTESAPPAAPAAADPSVPVAPAEPAPAPAAPSTGDEATAAPEPTASPEDKAAPADATAAAPAEAPAETAPTTEIPSDSVALPATPPAVPEPALKPVPPLAARPPPTPASHDVSVETGWNNAAGTGVRYLYLLPGTNWAVGASAGVTLWGAKGSAIVRRADSLESGPFFQGALGFTSGLEAFEVEVGAEPKPATFDLTPGRSIDLAYGTRLPLGASYAEFFVGYSINLRGTALQRPNADGQYVRLTDDDKALVMFGVPGGLGFGANWGVTF